MANTLGITDNVSKLRTEFNSLVIEFNDVSSFSSITTNAGTVAIGLGNTNKTVSIVGGNTNINTSMLGNTVKVNLNPALNISTLDVSGTTSLSTTDIISLWAHELFVGELLASRYRFPDAKGTAGQVLAMNAGATALEFVNSSVSTFKALSDTPSTYTTAGGGVPFFDGTAGGVGTNLLLDESFTYDPTNNILQISKIRIGEGISLLDVTPIKVKKTYTSAPSSIFGSDIDITSGSGLINGFDFTIDVLDTSSSSVRGSKYVLNVFNDTGFATGSFINVTSNGDIGDLHATDSTIFNGETAGTVYGHKLIIQNNGAITNNMYGMHIFTVTDGTVGGSSYGIYISRTSTPYTHGIYSQDSIKTDSYITHKAMTSTPTVPAGECVSYFKGTKYILAYNDAGTVRYKYLEMTGTGVTWVHTTVAP